MFPSFCVRIELRIFGECLVSPKVLFFPVSSSVRTPCVRSSSSEDRKGERKRRHQQRCAAAQIRIFSFFFPAQGGREREREKGRLFIRLSTEMTWFPFSLFQILEHNPFPTTFCIGISSVLFLLSARTRTYLWELQCFLPLVVLFWGWCMLSDALIRDCMLPSPPSPKGGRPHTTGHHTTSHQTTTAMLQDSSQAARISFSSLHFRERGPIPPLHTVFRYRGHMQGIGQTRRKALMPKKRPRRKSAFLDFISLSWSLIKSVTKLPSRQIWNSGLSSAATVATFGGRRKEKQLCQATVYCVQAARGRERHGGWHRSEEEEKAQPESYRIVR